jgi:carboxyl-terminal processing protease
MKQISKRYYILVTLLLLVVTIVTVSSRVITENDRNYFEISKNIRIMSAVYDKLNTYYVDEPQPGELMKIGIDAMLQSLDPYTVYIPQSNIEDYRFMTTGQYGGIGSLIQKHDEYIVISEPYDDSPAQKAGLKAGDILLEVDGKSVVGKTIQEMSTFLKGGAGTNLTIKYQRGDDIKSVTFKREEIKVADVPYYGMLDDKTGYIKLTSFTNTASTEVGKALRNLRDSSGMKQLVFDLRGNGGGLLHESVNIVNFFVPKGQLVVSTKGRLEEINREYKTQNAPFDLDMPLVVLIDEFSASASEIVSGSLQDLDRAVIIGQTSYGKGLVQQTKDIEFGSMVKLTVAKYYTPSGRCIQRLDYSHKNKEGKVEAVPDSLLLSFTTKRGRIVKDGRGIEPDLKIETSEMSMLTAELIIKHHIFNYATMYERSHTTIAKAKEFKLSEAEYADFKKYVIGQDINYTTHSKTQLKQLIELAEKERYYADSKAEFDALLGKLTPNLTDDLERYKDEITRLLEEEIVSRYYYSKGRLLLSLREDEEVIKALEVLNNPQSYNAVLGKK